MFKLLFIYYSQMNDQLKGLSTKVNEGTSQLIEDEMMIMTFGPKRHSRVHGSGASATLIDL